MTGKDMDDKAPVARRPAGSVREPTDLVVANRNGLTLEFTYPPQKPVKEYSQLSVRVDLEKLLADFPATGRTGSGKAPHPAWSYIPFANASHQAVDSDRSYRAIRAAIRGGQLDMPELGRSGFAEGNHRLLELQRQGFQEVYILVYPEQAADIEARYGVGPKKDAAAPASETPREEETIGTSAVEKYVRRGNDKTKDGLPPMGGR